MSEGASTRVAVQRIRLELLLQKTGPVRILSPIPFATPLAEKGFHLQQELDAGLLVECDAMRVRQALMALLENALRHADPGKLRVRLEQADGDCRLSVEDDGPGIDSALAADIFEAFRRGDPSRSRKSGGSGLGLAVVKAIAEAHGGQAICQASAKGGSCFVLSWPLRQQKQPPEGGCMTRD